MKEDLKKCEEEWQKAIVAVLSNCLSKGESLPASGSASALERFVQCKRILRKYAGPRNFCLLIEVFKSTKSDPVWKELLDVVTTVTRT